MGLLRGIVKSGVFGIGVGVGVAVVAPVLVPVLRSAGRKIAKEAIKGGMLVYRETQSALEPDGEEADDRAADAEPSAEPVARDVIRAGVSLYKKSRQFVAEAAAEQPSEAAEGQKEDPPRQASFSLGAAAAPFAKEAIRTGMSIFEEGARMVAEAKAEMEADKYARGQMSEEARAAENASPPGQP